MKRLILLLLIAVTSLSAKQKKLIGKADDPSALTKVQSFCVDVGQLGSVQGDDVKHFAAEQSKPGKILTKLPWKFSPDCSSVDAVATFTVEFRNQPDMAAAGAGVFNQRTYLPTLIITERSSGKTIYQVKGDANMREDDSFITPFFKLQKDLNYVQESGGH